MTVTIATYRYALDRETCLLTGKGRGLFVMLNPSTADEHADDPTIRRCKGFAERENWRAFCVVNLYAARATDPAALAEIEDPVGPDNYPVLVRAIRTADVVVAAWGATVPTVNSQRRPIYVFNRLLDELGEPKIAWRCLGRTANGAPRHPLYVHSRQPLVSWLPDGWHP